MAQLYVASFAVAIRDINGGDDSAVVRDPYLHPVIVGQRENLYFLAFGRNAKMIARNFHELDSRSQSS